MNQQDYCIWEEDARRALSGRYAFADRETILDWFRRIDGANERDLIGSEAVDAIQVFTGARAQFDRYNSLMARLFIYAPLILNEAKQSR